MYREQMCVLDDNKWSTIMHNTTLKKKQFQEEKKKDIINWVSIETTFLKELYLIRF